MPSELKVNKLSPYTGTTLTLGDSGDTVSTDAVVQASQFIGGGLNAYRNLIINGDMQIAQRSTSATGQSGYIAVDRFRCVGGPDAVDELSLTHAQVTDAPDGFGNSYKITVSTPETTLAADEMIRIEHRMEGQNLQYLKKGTSNAETVTLSFWIKGSITGTYIVNIHDSDNTRNIAASYTINSANTWEYKTITFVGDTTGALDNDNAQSLSVYWYLGAGTNWTSGTLGTSWSTFTRANAAVGQTDILTTSGATWQITGVQLEVGTSASDFEFLPYDVNLLRCQRYYQTISKMSGYSASAVTTFQCSVAFPITMRATPSLSQSGVFRFDDGASAITQSSTGFTTASLDNTGTILNVQNMTCNGTFRPHGKANTAKLEIDAEL